MNNEIYDFQPLSKDCRSYNVQGQNGNLYDFNFCSDIETDCGTFGLFVNKEKCTIYASSSKTEKKFEIIDVKSK